MDERGVEESITKRKDLFFAGESNPRRKTYLTQILHNQGTLIAFFKDRSRQLAAGSLCCPSKAGVPNVHSA